MPRPRRPRGYCLAVRSALTDDGRPPLVRLRAEAARPAGGDRGQPRAGGRKKGLAARSWPACSGCSARPRRPRPRSGRPSAAPTPGSIGRRTSSANDGGGAAARSGAGPIGGLLAAMRRERRRPARWPRRSTTSSR